MACAQTGSGKTAAFLLPTIQHLLVNEPMVGDQSQNRRSTSRSKYYPRALILAPTRELVQQIHAQARKVILLFSEEQDFLLSTKLENKSVFCSV